MAYESPEQIKQREDTARINPPQPQTGPGDATGADYINSLGYPVFRSKKDPGSEFISAQMRDYFDSRFGNPPEAVSQPVQPQPTPQSPNQPQNQQNQPPQPQQLPQQNQQSIQQSNAVQIQPDATVGTGGQAPVQVGGKFGTQQFGRQGNDVYEIMSDGSRRKVTKAEFNQKLKAQGLNLDVLPQLDLNDNVADQPAGPPPPDPIQPEKGPTGFLEDYKAIIKELGLSDIKSQFEATKKEYQDLQDKKNLEILEINDNPWLSEGIRQKQIKKIRDSYELKENTLSNQQKLYESMYEEGIAQAKFLTSGIQEDRNKLLDLATKREEAEQKLAPGVVGEYQFAKQQGYKGTFEQYQNEDANRKAKVTNETTEAINEIRLQLLDKELREGKPPTDAQRTLGTYASRMEQAIPTLESQEKSIVDMNLASFETQIRLPAALQTTNIQQYMQAARNLINAVLRRESGAVISPTEFKEARQQYLPQPGDGAAVLAQKKANRNIVFNSFKAGAGTAYQPLDELVGPITISEQTKSGLKYKIIK